MQPQQPEAPSEPQASPDTQSQPAPSEQSESPSQTGSWFRRLWRRGDDVEETDSNQEASGEGRTSERISLTQEELDRRVQAETDRRESKRLNEARAAERRRLRDEDPWAYAEQDRSAEQMANSNAQVSTLFQQIGAEHDKYSLDPLVMSLPEAERARILKLQGAGVGLDGRKLIVEEGLKALEKHWKAEGAKDAEDKLRRNPAFRKQVLGEFRRGMAEPEFIGSGPTSEAEHNVSNILRGGMSRHRSM